MKDMTPKEVYRIINRNKDESVGSYSRAYHDEYDFRSCSSARAANCHGIFKDKEKYKINKYILSYVLVEEGVDDEA